MDKHFGQSDGTYAVIGKMVNRLLGELESLKPAEIMYIRSAKEMVEKGKNFQRRQVQEISKLYKRVILPKLVRTI